MATRRKALNLLQTYETTLLESNGPRSFRALVIPSRSIRYSEPEAFVTHDDPNLTLSWITDIESTDLSKVLASMLVPEEGDFNEFRANETVRVAKNLSGASINQRDLAFATKVTNERLIPFESSPLTEKSLHELVGGLKEPDGVESLSSLVIAKPKGQAAEEIPLLVISRPDGLIVFGSGKSVRRAEQLGLWRRLYRFLRGEDDDEG